MNTPKNNSNNGNVLMAAESRRKNSNEKQRFIFISKCQGKCICMYFVKSLLKSSKYLMKKKKKRKKINQKYFITYLLELFFECRKF